MKNLPVKTLALLSLGTCLNAQQQWPLTSYDGLLDDTYWTSTSYYSIVRNGTMLGGLARYADVIGVGVVSDFQTKFLELHSGDYTLSQFTVTVDHALVGCTNGQSIVVYENFVDLDQVYDVDKTPYLPTNDSRIVFAVYTNGIVMGTWMGWIEPKLNFYPSKKNGTNFQLFHLNRSWWYPERDDGVLFNHFTNVIQAVRFDRNWTNYFHLVRDGTNSTSNRVREDSFWELWSLARRATDARAQFILDDPLVDPELKQRMVIPGWRGPKQDE